MAKTDISTKRIAIDKANAQMVAIVAAAAFIAVFSLVTAKVFFSRNLYEHKILTQKSAAVKQLESNLTAWEDLTKSYESFDKAPTNVLGGTRAGAGDNDGSNSKLILDALPSSYDYPALTSSIEKLLSTRGVPVSSISGTDDQANQQTGSSATPQEVPMPFSFSSSGVNYDAATRLFTGLQASIRPISVDVLDITGGSSNMTVSVDAHTYYQPGKSVTVTKKAVK